ncbi:MAG: DEAD/DEAH box helicase, partial [Candidatus Aenigmatarchaeota archaeon]
MISVIKRGNTVHFYSKYELRHVLKDYGLTWSTDTKTWCGIFDEGIIKVINDLQSKYPLKISDALKQEIDAFLMQLKEPLNFEIQTTRPSYKHQLESLRFALSHKRAGIFNEMGTGKTKIAIDFIELLFKHGKIKTCLVICPKSLIEKWYMEFEKFSNLSSRIGRDIFITNYDVFSHFYYKETLREKFGLDLDSRKIDCLILDEATFVKNLQAQRTRNIYQISGGIIYKLLLTGTPMTQDFTDIFALFLILDGGAQFGLHFKKFAETYGESYEIAPRHSTIVITKYKLKKSRERELMNKIYEKSIAFSKKDCLDLPDKIYDEIVVEPSDAQYEYYERCLNEDFLKIDEMTNIEIKMKLSKLHQITSGFIYREDRVPIYFDQIPKLDALEELLSVNSHGRVLIWHYFRAEQKLLKELCEKLDRKVFILDDTVANRNEVCQRFNRSPDGIMVAAIGVAKFGMEIFADLVVYYSNSFSVESRIHSEDRSHRLGTLSKVEYVDLTNKRMLDSKLVKFLKNRIDFLDYFY